MKLADSRVEEPSASAPPVRLYDELDESKDGCGGACWWNYVLKKPRTEQQDATRTC